MKAKLNGKILSLALSLGLLVSSTPAMIPVEAATVPSKDDVAVECSKYDLSAGKSTSVAIYYGGGQGKTLSGIPISWSVSDSSAATISSSGSTATLKIRKNNASFSIRANVDGQYTLTDEYETAQTPESATSVSLNTNSVTITGKGNTARVTVHIYPDDGKPGDNSFLPSIISSNSSVATGARASNWDTEWSGGYVTITAHGSGSATITVKCSNGPSASCHVTVNGISGATTVSTHNSTGTSSKKTTTTTSTKASTKPTATTSKASSGKPSVATASSASAQSAAQKAASSASPTGSTASGVSSVSSDANAALAVSSADSGTASSNAGSSAILAATNKEPAQKNNIVMIVIICLVAAAVAAVVAIVLAKRAKANKNSKSNDDTRPL